MLVGIPVSLTLSLLVAGASFPDGHPDRATAFKINAWPFLPVTFLFHWAAEYLLATVLWRSLRASPPLSLFRTSMRVAGALALVCALPALLAGTLLHLGLTNQVLFDIGAGLLLTGPGVLFVLGFVGFNNFSALSWLAALSTLTFCSVVLVISYSFLLVRLAAGSVALGKVLRLLGPASGPVLIAFSVGTFGLLTDLASSKPVLARLLGW